MVLNDTKEDLNKAMTQLQEAAKKIVQLETQLKGVKK